MSTPNPDPTPEAGAPADSRWRVPRALAPALAVAAVFYLKGVFYGRFTLGDSEQLPLPDFAWEKVGASFEIVVRDFLSRQTLQLSATAVVFFWLATVGFSLWVILRFLEGGSLRGRIVTIGLPAVASVVAVVQTLPRGADYGRDWILIRLPRSLLYTFAEETGLNAAFERAGTAKIVMLENLLSGLIISALLFVVAAVCTILWVGRRRSGEENKEPPDAGEAAARDVEWQRQRYRTLQSLLFLGAAVLVIGVLNVRQLLLWPAGFLGEGDAASVKTLVGGYSATLGFYWTMILVALYLPATLALRHESSLLAHRALPEATPKEHRKWLSEEKLSPSVAAQLSHLLAVVSPVLAGGPLALVSGLVGK